jgi:hypothetical protein
MTLTPLATDTHVFRGLSDRRLAGVISFINDAKLDYPETRISFQTTTTPGRWFLSDRHTVDVTFEGSAESLEHVTRFFRLAGVFV